MKKLVSIFTTIAVVLSLVALPVFADTTSTGTSIKGKGVYEKQLKALQNNLDKTTKALAKANSDKVNLAAKKEIDINKAKEKDAKQQNASSSKAINVASQIEKLNAAYQKTLTDDATELATLEKNIEKWTTNMNNRIAAFNKQIADIATNLNKRLAEIDVKIAAANGDATKIATLNATKDSLKSYAKLKTDAINAYMSALQPTWNANPSVWAAKKTALIARQGIDKTYRLAMLNIKIAELNDKLITPQTTTTTAPAPVGKNELQVNTKYQKQFATLDARISKLTKQIEELKVQISKLK